MQKLSDYTHARFCTDEADVLSGLTEIEEAMKSRRRMDKPIPNYYYIRRSKLNKKLITVATKGLRADEFRYGGIFSKPSANSNLTKILDM